MNTAKAEENEGGGGRERQSTDKRAESAKTELAGGIEQEVHLAVQ